MAHSSGITVDKSLAGFFGSVKDASSNIRCFTAKINGENVLLDKQFVTVSSDWKVDFVKFVQELHSSCSPCYIFFREDPKWIFIAWIPDEAKVQEKMLYSSTKAEIIKEFGLNFIQDKVSWSSLHPMSLKDYQQHQLISETEAALTMEEKDKKETEKNEIAHTGLRRFNKNFQGIDFYLTNEATEAINKFKRNELDLVSLTIDCERELITLSKHFRDHKGDNLISCCQSGESSYNLVRFLHHNPSGKQASLNFFCHFNSGYSSTIKSRMLFSSCKAALLDRLKNEFDIIVDFKLESESPEDFSAENLHLAAYPVVQEAKPVISKPKAAGRGPPRLIQ